MSPEGRISPQGAGIWDDAQEEAWGRIATGPGYQVPLAAQVRDAGLVASAVG